MQKKWNAAQMSISKVATKKLEHSMLTKNTVAFRYAQAQPTQSRSFSSASLFEKCTV